MLQVRRLKMKIGQKIPAEGQVLEEFMLEEEADFQEMDKCIVELPDKQEIDREIVVSPNMPVKTACEQEECIEEEIFIRSLPEMTELCKTQECVHKDGVQLEIPKVNTTEISGLPREIKLEKSIEKGKSKLHTKWKKVLGYKVVRKVNPTTLVKREVCRPPPKPPDRQNSLNGKHETKKGKEKPYKYQEIQNPEKEGIDAQNMDKELNYRPPPKPPYILDANGEVIGTIENVVPKTRPPLKPTRTHGSVVREEKDQEKECLLNTVLNNRPPPKPPPKSL